jgi:hypothetical protein
MKKSVVIVTDHAVLRYLERVRGLDVEGLRREIGARIDRVAREGACGVILDGWEYRLADGFVVTVRAASEPDKRRGRQRRERGE